MGLLELKMNFNIFKCKYECDIFSSSILYALFPVLGSNKLCLKHKYYQKRYLQDIPLNQNYQLVFYIHWPNSWGVFFETDFINNLTNNDPNYLNFI